MGMATPGTTAMTGEETVATVVRAEQPEEAPTRQPVGRAVTVVLEATAALRAWLQMVEATAGMVGMLGTVATVIQEETVATVVVAAMEGLESRTAATEEMEVWPVRVETQWAVRMLPAAMVAMAEMAAMVRRYLGHLELAVRGESAVLVLRRETREQVA